MKWTNLFFSGLIVWLIQLVTVDMLSINNVRPDFIVLLVLYWSILYGRFVGVVSGTLVGFVVDLTGTATFFGLSPLIYSITGYLSGSLYGTYSKLNPLYFSFFWITILCLQFLVFCAIQYQGLWVLNKQLFFGKWLGTCIYTITFAGILQLIYPLHRID